MSKGLVVVFSAPSGAGKSTIVHHLLEKFPQIEFSVSATSRAPRGAEVDGKEPFTAIMMTARSNRRLRGFGIRGL